MRVAFVLDDIILGHEPLGVMTLAGMLIAHGHEVEYFALGQAAQYPETAARVRAFEPRVIAYSSSTGVHKRYAEFNRIYRRQAPDVFSIFGGPHATFFPEFLEEHRDEFNALCVGEGEHALLELVEALERGKDYGAIQNLHIVMPDGSIQRNPTRCFLQDLDELPLPDRTFAERFPQLKESGIGYIMAGRGCPFNCSFCFNHVARNIAEGTYVRWRRQERVIAELRELKDKWGRRFISFQDDTLILNKKWFLEFAAMYGREIGLPYMAHVRADYVDREIADALKASNCVRAVMGLETGSDYLRNEIMGKRVTSEQIRVAARLITDRGIELLTQNMFGVPDETPATVLDTIGLNIECKAGAMVLNFFQPYPRTRLAEQAQRLGLWDGNPDHIEDSSHFHVVINLKHKDVIEPLAHLSFLFVDYPWLFRLTAPFLRAAIALGLPALCKPVARALLWYDRRTALKPPRGCGSRYHPPACLNQTQRESA
ncbi:MAG: radical SAM protein [Candidatus Sumerlaeota bacterium]|nr:radical SAM protein [Candidatus Sumerlaeota bacterium]